MPILSKKLSKVLRTFREEGESPALGRFYPLFLACDSVQEARVAEGNTIFGFHFQLQCLGISRENL